MNNVRNEKEDIAIDPEAIKRVIRDY
jgi:hypothetical protein